MPVKNTRILLNRQQYALDVIHKAGKQLYFADALSRASYDDKNFNLLGWEIEAQVNSIDFSNISEQKMELLKRETEIDEEMKKLKYYVPEGWPANKKELDVLIKQCWQVRDEIIY